MIGVRAADVLPVGEVVEAVHLGRTFRRHLLDVRAGGERLLGAGDDDAADPLVRVELGDRGGDLAHHVAVQRVERLGAVQRDQGDAVAGLGQDVLVHRARPFGLRQLDYALIDGPAEPKGTEAEHA